MLLISCDENKDNYKENIYPHKLIINYSSFGMETIVTVACEDFESQFNSNLKTYIIVDSGKIQLFYREIDSLKLSEDSINTIDTRAKIIAFYDNKADTICLGKTLVEYHGNFYENSDSMRLFFRNLDTILK